MCNKKYIEFSAENTVEVISMSGIKDGYDKKDKKAEEYEVKEYGEVIKYLVQFPGLTINDLIALNSSKAATFNTTGKTPYTCMVNPWTLTEIKNWLGGSVSANAIEDAVTEYRKAAIKEHGKGFARKNWKILIESEANVRFYVKSGDLIKAKTEFDKLKTRSVKWPTEVQERIGRLLEEIK